MKLQTMLKYKSNIEMCLNGPPIQSLIHSQRHSWLIGWQAQMGQKPSDLTSTHHFAYFETSRPFDAVGLMGGGWSEWRGVAGGGGRRGVGGSWVIYSSILFSISIVMTQRRQQANYPSEFWDKIRSEQVALASEVKKYKVHYLGKGVQKGNIDNFMRFSRELQLLLVSHCKNIIYVAPHNLAIAIDELTLLFDDLLKKYHSLFLNYHQKSTEQPGRLSEGGRLSEEGQQPRGHAASELCVLCSQQMNKIKIERVRSSLFNEIGLTGFDKDDDAEQKQDEDAQFFQEVNNLLTIKQGEIIKNQVEINNYKQIALNALNYLTAMKDHFTRDTILLPNHTWLKSAKDEMQATLREAFQGKIPPWISKMLLAFWNHYQNEVQKKRCEAGTQTDNNVQLEIIQLRKKVLISKEKLQAQQNLVKTQEKQLLLLKGDKTNLEAKIDYYKNQLAKLIQEIEHTTTENQILKMKLSNSKLNPNYDKNSSEKASNNESTHEISRSYILDQRKTQKKPTKLHNESLDQSILPKIKINSASKRSQHQIRTSIKVNLLSQSHTRLQFKKSTKKFQKMSEVNISGNTKNEQISLSLNDSIEITPPVEKEPKNIRQTNQTCGSSKMKGVIQEQFGELSMSDYKLKIKEVDQHLKRAIKQGIFLKKGQKNLFGSISQRTQLKRVPRYTMKPEEQEKQKVQLKINDYPPKRNNMLRLSKIYNYLKGAGYLVKISEEDFKDSIVKFKLLDSVPELNSSSTLKSPFKNRKQQMEKESLLKWSLYEQASCQQTRYNSSLDRSFEQHIGSHYLPLFINIQNAYLYETNMTKSHLNAVAKLDSYEQYLCQQLYDLITQLKTVNVEHYRLVCSFLRFPYQVLSNCLGTMNIGNEIKYNTFQHHFQRIMLIHQKCKKQEAACQHFREFQNKLNDTIQGFKSTH